MVSRTAAVYGVGGVLLVACLAAANMPQEPDLAPPRTARAERPAAPDALALEVSAQAARLHRLLAQAPAPEATSRNPFAFAPRLARPAASAIHAAVVDEPAPAVTIPLPTLSLIGVAEDTTPTGARRTAIIAGDGDTVYMVAEGEAVGDRYRVKKIGADAVELEDVATKAFRRLALR